MKKTLITLLALASVAVAADAGTEFTTTNSVTTTDSNYGCKGFIFNLNGSAFSTTSDPSGSAIEGMVELTSITLTTGSSAYWAQDGKYSLVITDTDFSIIGWSTTLSTASTTYTWNFVSDADNTPVVLDSSKDYLVLADSSTSFTAGDTLIKNNKVIRLGSGGVINYGVGNLDFSSTSASTYSGLEFIAVADPGDNSAYESYTIDNSTQYAPNVIFETKAVAVPEPTTATLSLLALAGLAARRRRK